ncbi:probable carotenoid cleavage dioxygenase 4 chloroplastic [Phtheirospermum japonicum]|uniref:Probable carotenoid cleavage dioxygenase 4 chloroplastic n=1 Tax=Phtheirospermum japonicum TaxID=374723 RepID=A0A830B355_9LAMI|nr:probable carotenoid cleavage dioxygenase 4 chloroplastic [Phtheirospermum japonicum]
MKLSLATLFKSLEDFVCNFIDLPLRPALDPKHVLSGNFAPADELPPTACVVVEGSIPTCLHGAYIRNGPNPQFTPRGPYHLFDGDGMLHMVVMSGDHVTFCSRYVKTYKYTVENKIGHPIFPSIFSSFNGMASSMVRGLLSVARILTGQFNPMINGFGLANTSVALIGGRLYALGESDLPYAIKVTSDGDIITLGRHNFFSDIEPFLSMTAHPKADPETGETFAFRYHVVPPFLTLFRIDANGEKQRDLPIFSMKSTSVTHDMAVTKNYMVFPDTQIVIDLKEILIKGRTPARVDRNKVPRLGIIPKNATDESELLWIEVPGFNMMHCFNAWEEDDGETIVMVTSNPSSVEKALERLDLARPRLERVTINVKAKTLERHSLSNEVLEMGVVNPNYVGKKSRYIYVGIVSEPMKLVGVVKIDLSRSDSSTYTVASRLYGPSYSGSEPFFVPREPDNPTADEDDGYLIAYIHDENTSQESNLLVMDAKSPDLEVVAVVKLPGRVPTGFHGLFLRESVLRKL